MNILIFIIILLVLVLVHEFGHFFSARKFGIRVDEFGFGFPPKLFGIKKGETEYSVNLLPIGGFVKIFGDNPDEESLNGPDAARSFVNKPKYQQAIVLFAGVFANFVLAWLLFSVGFMSGLPTSAGTGNTKGYALEDVHLVVLSVASDSPAEKALLSPGDKIVSVKSPSAGQKDVIDSLDDINPATFKSFIVAHPGEEVEIEYLRGSGQEVNTTKVLPVKNSENGEPMIGVSLDQIGIAKLPFFIALKEGLGFTVFITKSTAVGLLTLLADGIQGKGSLASVTGPVGMVGIVGDAYSFGFAYLLSFAALISVNLAIINLLPFPALDGGRLFFLLVEKIKGSRMNPVIVNAMNLVGFSLLIILMLVITYKDIVKLL